MNNIHYGMMVLIVYVDNILVQGSDLCGIEGMKTQCKIFFELKAVS